MGIYYFQKKKYSLIGYKGKQVRDNIHSYDLVNCFWEFYKKPKYGEVYNICLLYTSPSPRDGLLSRMPSSA